jgi:hypothetical protein
MDLDAAGVRLSSLPVGWDESIWSNATEFPHPRLESPDLDIRGSFLPHPKSLYSVPVVIAHPSYAILESVRYFKSGHYLHQARLYPADDRLTDPFTEPNATDYVEYDNCVILPAIHAMTIPKYIEYFLPQILAVPESARPATTVLIGRRFRGLDLFLANLGFSDDRLFSIGMPIKAEAAYVLKYPEEHNFFKWPIAEFVLCQRRAFGRIVREGIGILPQPEASVTQTNFDSMCAFLSAKDSRIRSILDFPKCYFARAKVFCSYSCLIAFSSDLLHLLPFMRAGSTAIIVQADRNFLEYAVFAKEVGIQVVLLPVANMSDIPAQVLLKVVDAVQKYHPNDVND